MKQSLPFLMFLVGVYYFLQAIGGNPGLHSQILQKYLKEVLKMSPTDMSLFGAALIIPWTIKPLYGMLSDFFPILGYRRKSYFIFSGILGWSAYFTLSQIGLNQETLKIGLVLAGISFAFADVLCDAVMVEKGQPLNATDRLQSTQWAALGLAGVLIAYWKGQIAEHWTLQEALWLVAIPPLLVIGFTALALKEEKSAVSWEMLKSTGHDIKNTVKNSWLILGLNALVIGMLWQWNHHPEYAKAMPQVALFANCITPIILFISRSFWVMAFLIVFGSLAYTLAKSEGANDETPQNAWQGLKKGLKSKVLWGTAIFLFLFNCNPNLGTVFYFYEKDVLKFSDELIGKIDMVGSIGFIIGALLYSAISKYFSHRWLLIAIIVTGVAGNLSYLWFESAYKHVYIGGWLEILGGWSAYFGLLKTWPLPWFGGAESGFLISGFSSIIAAVAFLGTLTVAAKACPKYAEGAIFAFIMSVMNFGGRIGDFAGSALWEKYTIAEKIDPRLAYARLIWIAAGFTATMLLFIWMAREEKKEK